MKNANQIIRQGDVILIPVQSMPSGLSPVPLDKGRIVLAYGEVTGHAHAIADHYVDYENAINGELAQALNAAAQKRATATTKATLYGLTNGQRFLEVTEPVNLTHEEHTPHLIPPGVYEVPIQVDMTSDKLPRRVAD